MIRYSCFYIIFICLLLNLAAKAQNTSENHNLYLLSNLESLPADAPELQAIETQIKKDNTPFTILINGDFVDKNGLGEKPEEEDINKLDRLIEMVGDQGRVIFVPGDREWDNGGKRGLKKVKALEKYLESKLGKGKVLFPQKGCLGPAIIDIGKHLRIVAINTQWFVEEHIGPEEEDADCGLLNATEFWFEMEDALGDSENKNVVVAGHHPVISYGQYAGYKLGRQHFLPPIAGSFIAAYRQSVGTKKDLNQKNLKAYSSRMMHMTQRFQGAIFVSGHEYDNQVLYKNNTYHINSGAVAEGRPVARGKETLYRHSQPAFSRLHFSEDGEVLLEVFEINNKSATEKLHEEILFVSPCDDTNTKYPKNSLYNPCVGELANRPSTTANKSSTTAIAGKQYKAGVLKRFLLGKHYRKAWAEPIADIPYLDLDTTFGGLKPYAKGGGAQTISLKFKSTQGRVFAFRSINKNPTQRMDQDLRPGVYGKITQDKTSHQHPYSSRIAGHFMDSLGLPHSRPQLYVMPDDPKLGSFREEFAGMYGTLEEKPKGKKKKRRGFRDADDVESTMQVYKDLIDDNDNRIDVDQFVKARLLDIWISDWDRHFNNYKWLAYEDGKKTTYSVFPKDRDKSFSLYQGVYWLIEVLHLQKDKSNFRKNYYGLKYLNFKNKTMDRWLASSYTEEDWLVAAKDFQNRMTDEVIANAISKLPDEVEKHDRKRMTKVLKARRARLPRAMKRYYKLLAKQIDLIGSNSKEIFELERLKNGDVQATIYNLKKSGKKGELLYQRLIKRKETKEIRVHALGKDDQIFITGESKKSILIRIIGGKGEDRIEDKSKVKGPRKMTKIYDKRGTDELIINEEAHKKFTDEILAFESDEFFHYDYLNVLPTFSFNQDDGFGIGITGTYTRQKFNKPDFGERYDFGASFTTKENYNIDLEAQFRHLIKKWDGLLGFHAASNDRSFRNFYGLSNDNIIDDKLREDDFYENYSTSLQAHLGLRRQFWNKSNLSIGGLFHTKDVDPESDEGDASIYDDAGIEEGNGLGRTTLLGPVVRFNIDLRDSGTFPTKGIQVKGDSYNFTNTSDNFGTGGRSSLDLSTFFTAGVALPVTLALRGGLISSYGDVPFYYKAYLGQQTNFRGYRRNRFGGDTAAFLNTDLRFHFGKVITPLVPIKYGVFGLFDTGRTWREGESSEQLHYSYGGGVYLVPYTESFNMTFTASRSDEGNTLFQFRIGFFVR
ncbi:MAG: metallophosphoesterase [Saprospiraceae bacterium]